MDVDIEGCKSLLNPVRNRYCVVCNVHEMRSRKIRCSKCPCIFHSAPKAGVGSRVGMSGRFKEYGILKPDDLGKYQFFYYMYHPELKFESPDLPLEDLEGNFNKILLEDNTQVPIEKQKIFKWIIHHENGIWHDDRVWNLIRMLNTEHGVIHGEMNREYKPWKLIQEAVF